MRADLIITGLERTTMKGPRAALRVREERSPARRGGLRRAPGHGRLRRGQGPSSAFTPGRLHQAGLVGGVERERGCRVVLDTSSRTKAMYAKLRPGPRLRPPHPLELHGQPDARPGDARRLDHGLLPNLVHVDPTTWPSPWTGRWTTPCLHAGRMSGIAYLEGRVKTSSPAGDVRPRGLAGRMTMFNDMRRDDRRGLRPWLQHTTDGPGPARRAEALLLAWRRTIAKSRTSSTRSPSLGRVPPRPRLERRRLSGPPGEPRTSASSFPRKDDHLLRRPGHPGRRPEPPWPTRIDFLHDPAVAARTPWPFLPLPEQGLLSPAPGRDPGQPGDLHPSRDPARSEVIADIARPTPSTSRSGTASRPPAERWGRSDPHLRS